MSSAGLQYDRATEQDGPGVQSARIVQTVGQSVYVGEPRRQAGPDPATQRGTDAISIVAEGSGSQLQAGANGEAEVHIFLSSKPDVPTGDQESCPVPDQVRAERAHYRLG